MAVFLGFWLVSSTAAYGQGERNHWHFPGSSLHFTPAGPVAGPSGDLNSEETGASISDAAGNLLFYTDGATVWNRLHQPMPNGRGSTIDNPYHSTTQGALIVQDPGHTARYYVFRLADYAQPDGLSYLVVDLRLAGGLGDVVGPAVGLTGASRLLSEKLTGVVHANGRDTWVLVHGLLGSTTYYAYLVSPAGVSPAPVATAVGLPHGGPIGGDGLIGYLRASPNGTKLAAAVGGDRRVDLLDFDTNTGRPANSVALGPLPTFRGMYGVEFSADGTKLYATDIEGIIYQFDLLAGTGVAASRVEVGRVRLPNAGAHAVLRGPDGRIYVAQNARFLGVIDYPERAGLACGYREQGLTLFPGRSAYGLPNFPNQFATPGRFFARITAGAACPGGPVSVAASLAPAPALPGARYAWDFGDPAAGSANTGRGANASHVYATAGTYLVTLRVEWPAGGPAPVQTTALVQVLPVPALNLAPRSRLLCPGHTLRLDAGAAVPGTRYRWQDGTAVPIYSVTSPGTYRLTATSALGCQVQDSVVVTTAPVPQVSLGIDTAMCTYAPMVQLHASSQPAGTTYRWQDGSTAPAYTATQPGVYRVQVTNAAGCTSQAQVTVALRTCPVVIPNVITPNGDSHNDYWVPQGMNAAEWSLAIYARWGQEVYATPAYDNRWQAAGLNNGLYYYRLTHQRTGQQYRGWVEVLR